MVRSKTKWKTISISEHNYNRLEKDRLHFQDLIKGGKWSLNDTITEYIKILNHLEVEDN